MPYHNISRACTHGGHLARAQSDPPYHVNTTVLPRYTGCAGEGAWGRRNWMWVVPSEPVCNMQDGWCLL